MRKTTILLILIAIGAVGAAAYFVRTILEEQSALESDSNFLGLPGSPLDATYRLEGREVVLHNGSVRDDEGTVSVQGAPAFGYLNGDDGRDAALVLRSTRGAEEVTYVAIAIEDGGGYLGSDSIVLGTEAHVTGLRIENEVLTVGVTTNDEGVESSIYRHFILVGGSIHEVTPLESEEITGGYYTWDGEEFSFRSCDGKAFSVATTSRASAALRAVYEQRAVLEAAEEVFAVVVGSEEQDEGAVAVLAIHQLLSAPQQGSCEDAAPEVFEDTEAVTEATSTPDGEEGIFHR